MPRLEVSPAQRHPASQQGGGGRWKPGWRSLGEVGGWRFFTILLFSCKIIWFSINLGVELNGERIFGWKWKFSFQLVKFSMTCELWIGGPAHEPVFSRVGEDEMNKMKVKVLSLFLNSCQLFLWMSVLDTVLRTKVLVRWFNKSKYSSLFLQKKNNKQTSI